MLNSYATTHCQLTLAEISKVSKLTHVTKKLPIMKLHFYCSAFTLLIEYMVKGHFLIQHYIERIKELYLQVHNCDQDFGIFRTTDELSSVRHQKSTQGIQKVRNVCAYNPRSCLILADESCGVFSIVWTVAWCSSCCKLFHVVSVIG